MITKYHRNCMGTVSFEAQFPSMRKSQEFIVYPIKTDCPAAKIQSDTRIGLIHFETGAIVMSAPKAGGAYSPDLAMAKLIGKLDAAELLVFKAQIVTTAGSSVGTHGVTCDNSGAAAVLAIKEE